MFENSQNPPDELAQNVSKKKTLSDELFLFFFFQSSESYRVFNYVHDSNSFFSGRENYFRRGFGRQTCFGLFTRSFTREHATDTTMVTRAWLKEAKLSHLHRTVAEPLFGSRLLAPVESEARSYV